MKELDRVQPPVPVNQKMIEDQARGKFFDAVKGLGERYASNYRKIWRDGVKEFVRDAR